jgi:hypothetical protein
MDENSSFSIAKKIGEKTGSFSTMIKVRFGLYLLPGLMYHPLILS